MMETLKAAILSILVCLFGFFRAISRFILLRGFERGFQLGEEQQTRSIQRSTTQGDEIVRPGALATDGSSSAFGSEALNNAPVSGSQGQTSFALGNTATRYLEFIRVVSGQVNIPDNYGMVFLNLASDGGMTTLPARNADISFSIQAQNNNGQIFIGNNMVCNILSPQKCLSCQMDDSEKKLLERLFRIVNDVGPLCDNGEWEAFYGDVEYKLESARQNRCQEVFILLLIQKSIGLSHEKKNDDALKAVEKAKDKILKTPGLRMREFLTALALCQSAAIDRRANHFEESNDDIYYALQNLEFKSSQFAKALVLYEGACNLYVQYFYHPELNQDRVGCAERAKMSYKTCISMSKEVLKENPEVYIQKHQNALVKCALLNLNFTTSSARKQPVSKESISEAENCIRTVQQEDKNITKCTKMLLTKAKAGLYYRKGDIVKAKQTGADALCKAKNSQFQVEVDELQDFCDELSQLKEPKRLEKRSQTADL